MHSLSRRDFNSLAVDTAPVTVKPETAFGQGGMATKEPTGGQPAPGQRPSVPDLEYQVMYQRAFEAVLGSLPAVAIYRLRAAAFSSFGIKDNDILSYSKTATPKLEALTANSSTPYVGSYCDLRTGPTVLEVPEADSSGSLYGQSKSRKSPQTGISSP